MYSVYVYGFPFSRVLRVGRGAYIQNQIYVCAVKQN